MIYYTVEMHGGLGNQLFQVSSIWGLAKKHGATFVVDRQYVTASCAEHIGQLDLELFERFITDETIVWDDVYIEDDSRYGSWYEDVHPRLKNTVFKGFYQSPKYFSHMSEEIVEWLLPVHERSFGSSLEDVVVFHLRLGDYYNHPVYYIPLKNYYERCIEMLKDTATPVIVTNNLNHSLMEYPELCEKYKVVNETNPLKVLKFLSQVGGGIVCANSTFSWWGSYLNYLVNNNRSIAPSKWYTKPEYEFIDIIHDGMDLVDV